MNTFSKHNGKPLRSVLTGVKVVEFEAIGPTPFAAMHLADMGADVVRLVRPGTPDDSDPNVINRGRMNIRVDLKQDADIERVVEILKVTDILVEGFRPGVMERLGLGPNAILNLNPRIVFGRMTGWGQEGPLASAAGHDINYISVTGALAAIGPRQNPSIPLNLVGDYGGGAMYLLVGVLGALLHARATGEGQVVDCAMCDGATSLMSVFYEMFAKGTWNDERASNPIDGSAYFYNLFECADGKFISVGAIEPQFNYLLLSLLGLEADPAFAEQYDPKMWAEQKKKLASVFLQRGRDEWCALLEGTDACFAPVLNLAESPMHPHLVKRGTFVDMDGTLQPGPAPRFSATPSAVRCSRSAELEEVIARWSA